MRARREEIGENLFNQTLQKYCEEYKLGKGEYAVENPTTVSDLVTGLHGLGAKSETVECIVKEIVARV